MATITIRNLDDAVAERLRAQARRHNRSLEAGLRALLTDAAAAPPPADFARISQRIRALAGPRRFGDSTALVREGRGR